MTEADLPAEVAALARAVGSPAQGELVAMLAQGYVRSADPVDLATLTPSSLVRAAAADLQLAQRRAEGVTLVRVGNPDRANGGSDSPHTVVDVVTDDMPFLVDSVSNALVAGGHGLHVVLHPTLMVHRDADGTLVDAQLGTGEAHEWVAESFLHFEIDRETDRAVLDDLRTVLVNVLDDVRAVVGDWQPMRDRALDLAKALQARPPPTADPDEVAEAGDYLEWLTRDHFTFVGYCEYDLVERAGEDALRMIPGSALGLVRRRALREYSRVYDRMPPEARRRARDPHILVLTTSQVRSTVHRRASLDYVGVKRFDEHGNVIGECRFTGLYTSGVYTESTRHIPVLRRKVAGVLAAANLAPASHDGRALVNVLETYPRDDLFRMTVDELADVTLGIVRMGPRRRVRLFVSYDEFCRFVSCLVYLPRDRYTTTSRVALIDALQRAFRAPDLDYTVLVTESPTARLHVVLQLPDEPGDVDVAALEAELGRLTRLWVDDLRDVLVSVRGEERGLDAFRVYGDAFSGAYQADVAVEDALADLAVIEKLDPDGDAEVRVETERAADGESPGPARLKLFRSGSPLVLSDVIPVLEHLGITVLDEHPYTVTPATTAPRWIYSFGVRVADGNVLTDPAAQMRLSELFLGVLTGMVDNDGLNRLVLGAGLGVRDVVIVRALCKYLPQAGQPFAEPHLADALSNNPQVTRLLVSLFHARFDPNGHRDLLAPSQHDVEPIVTALTGAIDAVRGLYEDRILRSLMQLVLAIVRTNAYQVDEHGSPKSWVSFKLDPAQLEFLAKPRPRHEIWVYSPRVEAVHMRGGDVARGGIRWSDRRDDVRTEVLDLMKTQTIKNAVIVPVGAKGGFVVKRPPTSGDPKAMREEVIACYGVFMRGMLDVTDNLVGRAVVPPRDVVRYDGNDPYLVVAADKGTATFSDYANSIAAEYGLWLGDAFASGGSTGYDHKAMGITARGAWVSVKAHFRAMGIDADTAPISVVGIGDMSGDVFGNGLLQSPHLRLIAAFDHRHVFVDPDPDPAGSYPERLRLFQLPQSSWADYDPALISAGGGVFPRTAKSIPLSPETRTALGTDALALTPTELIRAILRAPVDLMWSGGIGTFVKASTEAHRDVEDRTNDDIRVNASELRCRVVAEGGNLGLTQRARVEFALGGGRINTDSIDNSAGVDCSDHEVNIKILLDAAIVAGELPATERNQLLVAMTDDVAAQVLADNKAQTTQLAWGHSSVVASSIVAVESRLMDRLEQAGHLDRDLEALPDTTALEQRVASGHGLTSPEVAVLMAHAKLELQRDLIESDVPDDPYLHARLLEYFPTALRAVCEPVVAGHPLHREIVATIIANAIVNRGGTSFVSRLTDELGVTSPLLARAHVIACDVFDVDRTWHAIDELDLVVPAATQDTLFLGERRLVERATRWFVRHGGDLPLGPTVETFREGVARVMAALPGLLGAAASAELTDAVKTLRASGVPEAFALRKAAEGRAPAALDIVDLAALRRDDPLRVARVYFAIADELSLDDLRARIAALPTDDRWILEARAALVDDVDGEHRLVTAEVLGTAAGADPPDLEGWTRARSMGIAHYRQVIDDIAAAGVFDLTTLTVAGHALRALCESSSAPAATS